MNNPSYRSADEIREQFPQVVADQFFRGESSMAGCALIDVGDAPIVINGEKAILNTGEDILRPTVLHLLRHLGLPSCGDILGENQYAVHRAIRHRHRHHIDIPVGLFPFGADRREEFMHADRLAGLHRLPGQSISGRYRGEHLGDGIPYHRDIRHAGNRLVGRVDQFVPALLTAHHRDACRHMLKDQVEEVIPLR